jgi:hypothetical protein
MADLEWPADVCPAALTWRPESNTKTFRSFQWCFTDSPISRHPLGMLPDADQPDRRKSRQVDALIASLDGEYGRVKIRDWGRPGRTSAGDPLVSDPDQSGTELHSKNWPADSLVLRAGDYITVNDELKMVTADVTSAANGTAIIPVAPMLRSSPPANSPIEVANPTVFSS